MVWLPHPLNNQQRFGAALAVSGNQNIVFSVITPNFNGGGWLRLCVASVADQGIPHEHIVQDAGSGDGTLDWLSKDLRIRAFVEKDQGMYDAINRGFRRAEGELLAWLNADEQFLPGTLQKITEWFREHPETDVVFGDVIFIREDGTYAGHRKMQVPLLHHTWTCHLSTLSCGMFFRQRLISDRGFFLDSKWRISGDAEWVMRLLQNRVKMGTLGGFTSVFTLTGGNLSAGANAVREARNLRAAAPAWARWLRPALIAHHRVRRLLGGMYFQKPFSYEIYTLASPGERKRFDVFRPAGHRRN